MDICTRKNQIVESHIKTTLGGILTLSTAILTIIYALSLLSSQTEASNFHWTTKTIYKTQEITLETYKDSLNMIVGTTNTEIDLYNNKLISFKVYRVSKLPG